MKDIHYEIEWIQWHVSQSNEHGKLHDISSLEQTSHGIQTSLHIQTSPGVRRSHEMLVLVEAAKMLLSFHRPSSTSSRPVVTTGRHPVVTGGV